MRKIKMILLGGILGGLLGEVVTTLVFGIPIIRESVYSRLGYYMTYLPVVIDLLCAIIGALIAVSHYKKNNTQ